MTRRAGVLLPVASLAHDAAGCGAAARAFIAATSAQAAKGG